MAVFTKYWPNGDALTLETGAGVISVSSDANLTGADRQMNIQVQTTNSGEKVTVNRIVKQKTTDGYWIHRTTNVKNWFGLTGEMTTPIWKDNAKEIRVPTGVTSLATQCFANSPDLETLILPSTLLSIGAETLKNTLKMSILRLYAINPPLLDSDIGGNVGDLANIRVQVPAESVNAYKSAPIWSNFAPFIIAIP